MSQVEESEDQKKERLRKELEGKNIQHYTVLATAWIGTKMEHDKTIITISAGAIGLLVTILTAKGIEAIWHIWLFLLAFIGYTIAIFVSIIIFQKNSVRIEEELRQEDGHEYKLKRLDKVARWSFILATVAFIAIGICSAISKAMEIKEKCETKALEDANKAKQKPAPSKEQQTPLKNIPKKPKKSQRTLTTSGSSIVIINCCSHVIYSSCRQTK